MNDPLISVIVPVDNVKDYLDTCLKSIVNQSYRHLEILLVDDGSTDGSGNRCDYWAEQDDRIRVFHQPNSGPSVARNTALDDIHGEYVFMVDSDDIVHRDSVSILLNLLRTYDADIAICPLKSFTGEDASLPVEPVLTPVHTYNQQQAIMAVFYQQDGLTHSPCGRLYKASLFEHVRYPEGKLYEDLAVIYPLLQHVGRVVMIDAPLYGYRRREHSIMQTFSPQRAAVLDICEDLEHVMQQNDPQYLPAVRSRLLSAYFNILLLSRQEETGDYQQLADRCWQGIKRLRHGCLIDGNVRLKNKAGILASYLGRTFLCDILGRKYIPKR